MKKKIAVAGTGYVGLSMAVLLAQHHQVTAVDIVPEKVESINNRISTIQDEYIEKYLAEKDLDLTATLDAESAYRDAEFVVIAAPTNYDPKKNYFDTSAVESVIRQVMAVNPAAIMVIKSTIPVGFTVRLYALARRVIESIRITTSFFCSTSRIARSSTISAHLVWFSGVWSKVDAITSPVTLLLISVTSSGLSSIKSTISFMSG